MIEIPISELTTWPLKVSIKCLCSRRDEITFNSITQIEDLQKKYIDEWSGGLIISVHRARVCIFSHRDENTCECNYTHTVWYQIKYNPQAGLKILDSTNWPDHELEQNPEMTDKELVELMWPGSSEEKWMVQEKLPWVDMAEFGL